VSKEHNPNPEIPADADDIDAEDSLVAEEASLLQAVEVQAEPVAERQRQLLPKFPHSVEQVWQVLTDYEALANFYPQSCQSRRFEHPTGGIRLEQVVPNACYVSTSARVILERKISMKLISIWSRGMKAYSGTWRLEPYTL